MPRDKSIDALKGLAIILVVAGHAIPFGANVVTGGPGLVVLGAGLAIPNATAHGLPLSLIYSVHMPLFAFVSGLVMWPPRTTPLAVQLFKRARGLLIPFFAWLVITFFLNAGITPATVSLLPATLEAAVMGLAGLWYLYTLFVAAMIIALLERTPWPKRAIGASALVAMACSTGLLFKIPSILNFSNVLYLLPYVALGYLTSSVKPLILNNRSTVAHIAVAVFVPLFYLRHPFHMGGEQPLLALTKAMHTAGFRGVFVIRMLVPYVSAAAAAIALMSVYIGRSGFLVRVQAWIGQRSLGIYAIHALILTPLLKSGMTNPWLLTVLSLAGSTAITIVIERVPYLNGILLGQWKRKVNPIQLVEPRSV